MNTTNEPFVTYRLNTSLANQLNPLLADEYILMNKTVTFLLNMNSTPPKEMVEQVYDELKKNVSEVKQVLQSKLDGVTLSIDDFINNTRLQTHSKFTSQVALFELLIADHHFIVSNLNAIINGPHEDDIASVMTGIKNRHLTIAERLRFYLQQTFN